jgi:hydroxyacylglutathione hydrolase
MSQRISHLGKIQLSKKAEIRAAPRLPEEVTHKTQGTGPKELLPGVFLVAGHDLSHPLDANAILIGGPHPILIDTGSTQGFDALKNNVEAAGYSLQDIHTVIATHAHWDHISGMAQLQKQTDAKLYLNHRDRKAVETADVKKTAEYLYGGLKFPKLHVDGDLRDGQTFDTGRFKLHVVTTPGHTPGSVSVILEADGHRIAILGDTVRAHFNLFQSNLKAWQKSLDKLIAQKPDLVIAGHTGVKLQDHATERLREAALQLRSGYVDFFFRAPGRQPKYAL